MAKKKNEVVVAEVRRGRGRPPVYTGDTKEKIVALLVEHKNATKVRNLLNSRNGAVGLTKVEKEFAATRRSLGFTQPLNISQPTLLKLASEAEVALTVGRPKVAVAA